MRIRPGGETGSRPQGWLAAPQRLAPFPWAEAPVLCNPMGTLPVVVQETGHSGAVLATRAALLPQSSTHPPMNSIRANHIQHHGRNTQNSSGKLLFQ